MLTVHRHDLRAVFPGTAHDDVARAHERFFIGQRDAAAFLLREYPTELAWKLLDQNPRCVLRDTEIETDEPRWFD